MADRVHLGDGAYVRTDGWYIWLEAERPVKCPNCDVTSAHIDRVALEPSALVALVEYAVRLDPLLSEPLTRAADADRAKDE